MIQLGSIGGDGALQVVVDLYPAGVCVGHDPTLRRIETVAHKVIRVSRVARR
ncbi:Uncharacterised protein [Mycobacteroides abscessus]|nr:Uncharacterised protein [Mycobacteroides abscessus]